MVVIAGTVVVVATVCLTLLYPYFKQETNLYNVVIVPCAAMLFLCIAHWDWMNQVGRMKVVRWLAGLGLEVYLCQSFATLVLSLVKADGGVDEVAFILLSVMFAVAVNMFFTKTIRRKARG